MRLITRSFIAFLVLVGLGSFTYSAFAQNSDFLRDDEIQVLNHGNRATLRNLKTPLSMELGSPISDIVVLGDPAFTPVMAPCRANQTEVWEKGILYLYPRSSVTPVDQIRATMELGTATLNQTIQTSQSGPYQFRTVGIEPVDYFPAASLGVDTNWMFNSDEVAALWARYGPNLIISLWVEGFGTDGYAGLAGGGYGSTFHPYNAVRMGNSSAGALASAVEIFVHEVGHNLGMHHQEQDPATGPGAIPSFSYGWVDAGDGVHPGRRDIMTIALAGMCPLGCPPELAFSNSNIGLGIPNQTENFKMVGLAFHSIGSTRLCVAK